MKSPHGDDARASSGADSARSDAGASLKGRDDGSPAKAAFGTSRNNASAVSSAPAHRLLAEATPPASCPILMIVPRVIVAFVSRRRSPSTKRATRARTAHGAGPAYRERCEAAS